MNERALELVVPGDLQTVTGGYGYDRRIAAGLRALGWRVTVHSLDESFPHATAAALDQAHEVLAGMDAGALVLIDGLALGAMPEVLHRHRSRLRLIALIHHPLAAETGLTRGAAQALEKSERQALRAVCHVVVTSCATRDTLLALRVEPDRVSVVEPGTDVDHTYEAPPERSGRHDVVSMLCVASLIPRKGHDVLIDALEPLAHLPWRLTCAGSIARSPATAERLHSQLRRARLAERVALVGEVTDAQLARLYREADLFVLPTHFEGYGMAVAEAVAHGLPVVSTTAGAIQQILGARTGELVPPGSIASQAGLLVAPGDVSALRAVLERVLQEPRLLASLAAGAARRRTALPCWPDSCAHLARILNGVLDQ